MCSKGVARTKEINNPNHDWIITENVMTRFLKGILTWFLNAVSRIQPQYMQRSNCALAIFEHLTPSQYFFLFFCEILVVALSSFPALRTTTTNSCYKFSILRKQDRKKGIIRWMRTSVFWSKTISVNTSPVYFLPLLDFLYTRSKNKNLKFALHCAVCMSCSPNWRLTQLRRLFKGVEDWCITSVKSANTLSW